MYVIPMKKWKYPQYPTTGHQLNELQKGPDSIAGGHLKNICKQF